VAAAVPALFLLVDAIPFSLARELHAAGGMPGFREPRPMVSVFPSLTDVAVAALLSAVFDERPPGYEARWYHPPSGEVRGPGDPASELVMEPLRARPHGLLAQAAIYLVPRGLAYAQVRWITRRFAREGGSWLGYLSATDGVGHFGGREALADALADVIASVDALRREHQRREGVWPRVVLCSDHGMAFGAKKHLSERALAAHLEEGGFRSSQTGQGLDGDGFVLVPWGDVGGGVIHADSARACELAARAACAPGVDLAFGRCEDGCRAFGLRFGRLHSARLRWHGDRYRYEGEVGDPLGYAPLFDALARRGALEDGWARDADLFAASWAGAYPDALARVRRGLEDLVEHPAAVLFSMQDDVTFGPLLTHAGAVLMGGQVGSHGSLGAEQSLGFAAATDEDGDPWPGAPALRPEQVLRPWRDLLRGNPPRD
jgi:hypothetical protein